MTPIFCVLSNNLCVYLVKRRRIGRTSLRSRSVSQTDALASKIPVGVRQATFLREATLRAQPLVEKQAEMLNTSQ